MRSIKDKKLLFLILAVLTLLVWRVPVTKASGIIASAYNTIQDEGSSLTQRNIVNFTGTGVTCSDGGTKTNCSVPGIPTGFYSQSFTSQTSVTLTHNLGTTIVIIQCYDGSTPPVNVDWDTLTLTDSNNATVTFTSAQSGICYVNSQSGGNTSVTKLSGTATINFSSSINDGACAVGGTTITVTGANVGDPVIVAPSVNLASGIEGYGKVTGSNTVTAEVCNFSGGANTPGSATWTAQIFH